VQRGVFARATIVTAGLIASLALFSCSPDLRGTLSDFQLLVFPGEAELGGSAAALIDSNYLPGGDSLEKYTIKRSQIGIQIKDANNTQWNATVRAVFPVGAAPTSRLAETKPGAWATVVLFDLPNNPAFQLGEGPPFLADVRVLYNGQAQTSDGAIGSIRITGRGGPGVGGQPTTLVWPVLTDLEPQPYVLRLRPNLDVDGGGSDGGFAPDPEGITIGGIQGDLIYLTACLQDFEPDTGTEAADAGIYVGPEKVFQGSAFLSVRRLVVSFPNGFTLTPPEGGVSDALGEGPVIELSFDRPSQNVIGCSGIPLVFRSVYVVAPDGSTIADERSLPYAPATSPLFTTHVISVN
jgi:hypothetical protein